jgi:hypothetical protein
MAGPPPFGQVRIIALDPPLQVQARLGEDAPTVDTGFGGWDSVERPRRKPITSWKGQPQLQLTLPLLLDGWSTGTSVLGQVKQLRTMGQPSATDGEPPQLKLKAQGDAVPFLDRTWVVNDIQWGEALADERGNLVRQALTLVLLEYVQDRYLAQRSAANRRRSAHRPKKRGAKSKRMVAKRSAKGRRKGTHALLQAAAASSADADFGTGEDLVTIAARELGDADRWMEIAELNGLRDPRAISPGQVLRLP